jgi:hypothetical protein
MLISRFASPRGIPTEAVRCFPAMFPASSSIGSPEHLVPGTTPVSSRCLQAPARDHGPVLNQSIEYRSNAQSAIISAFQHSIVRKNAICSGAPRQ